MCVVPADVQRQVLPETRATVRHQQPCRTLEKLDQLLKAIAPDQKIVWRIAA
jgi:hypothetical protein